MSPCEVTMEEKQRVVMSISEFLEKLRADRITYGEHAQARMMQGVKRFTIYRQCMASKGMLATTLQQMVQGYGGVVKIEFPEGPAVPARRRYRPRRPRPPAPEDEASL
jgi:predicted DNA-binding protein (UPF0251 family)